MTIEELRKKLANEEEMMKKLEFTIHQTIGRIAILKDLINQESQEKKSE